jgi:ribonuclease R
MDLWIQEAVLRTQSQAVYDPENIGHFGLNLSRYAHFTSPIRRYAGFNCASRLDPRPQIWRLTVCLTVKLKSLMKQPLIFHQQKGVQCSPSEAQRNAIYLLLCPPVLGMNLQDISLASQNQGLFIRLDDTGAEGFSPMSYLGRERFFANEDGMSLTGGTTGKTYRIGQDYLR